jgi:hypothetical protein
MVVNIMMSSALLLRAGSVSVFHLRSFSLKLLLSQTFLLSLTLTDYPWGWQANLHMRQMGWREESLMHEAYTSSYELE